MLGKRLNKVTDMFKALEDFTLEKNVNIHKELEQSKHVVCETKEIITSLKYRLMNSLSTTETTKAEMEALKGRNEA